MIALSQASAAGRSRPRVLGGQSRAVGVWLFVTAAMVFAMVVVGGATRLTGSGLSITEWKPLSGALPPMSASAWSDLFGKYRATSQYRLINQGISLPEFQVLFWWEWAHRLLGRSVGVVFAGPFLVFLTLGRIPTRLVARCWALLALGGLQGLAGWWMVQSGLEGRASVAPERLAIHLGLALVLFCALVWTGAEAWAGETRAGYRRRDGWGPATAVLAALIYAQCLLGALVAGAGGGRVDNDWPMMGRRWIPDDYWRGDLWTTIAHNPSSTQFDHRLLAYGLLLLALALAARALVGRPRPRGVVGLAALTLGLALAQAGLGVATLLAGDPLWLALIHQANAVLTLTSATSLAWRSRRI